MGWKKWPYWMRGGVVGGLVPFKFYVLAFFIPPKLSAFNYLGFIFLGVMIGFFIGKIRSGEK